jgi:hypothetical protein
VPPENVADYTQNTHTPPMRRSVCTRRDTHSDLRKD